VTDSPPLLSDLSSCEGSVVALERFLLISKGAFEDISCFDDPVSPAKDFENCSSSHGGKLKSQLSRTALRLKVCSPALARIACPRFPLTIPYPCRPSHIRGLERVAASSPPIRRLMSPQRSSSRAAQTEMVSFWSQPKPPHSPRGPFTPSCLDHLSSTLDPYLITAQLTLDSATALVPEPHSAAHSD